MAKRRTYFLCQQCGAQQTRWMGKCPECGEWDSLVEQLEQHSGITRRATSASPVLAMGQPQPLSRVTTDTVQRLPVLGEEFSRVLGGGLVPGSVALIGGDPGIGKCVAGSTRLLDPISGALLPITAWATEHHPVISLDRAHLRFGVHEVTAFYDQDVRDIVCVTTALGHTLRCTSNHPILTPAGWCEVGEVEPGELLATPWALPYFGNMPIAAHDLWAVAAALAAGDYHHDGLPSMIFCVPRHQMAFFLQIVLARSVVPTADGSWMLRYTTPCRRCAEDIQHLIRRFGCHAQLIDHRHAISNDYSFEVYHAANPELDRFLAIVGLIEDEPGECIHDEHGIYWDTIESVVPAGTEHVYDLGVAGAHCFVANDVLVHNSTLLLQVAAHCATHHGPALYVSAEESAQQIKLRAERLDLLGDNLYVISETNLNTILDHIVALKPTLVIVDSIQTVYLEEITSAAGSVSQVREGALRLLQLAKQHTIPMFLVGHVTKEGVIAGPRVLEHIVDVVLALEGERFHQYRLLRGVKNRFGSTNEVGIFEMTQTGMCEVANPSQVFIAERSRESPGSAIAVTFEGTRPLLVEVQALTSHTGNAQPRRIANGFDMNRLLMLTAVLSKRVGIPMFQQDIYVNIVGGLRISEPAADLAVALAIASSHRNQRIDPDVVLIGEIGLSGELRTVSHIDQRLGEAAKLGFHRALTPHSRQPTHHNSNLSDDFQVVSARSLPEVVALILAESDAPTTSQHSPPGNQ